MTQNIIIPHRIELPTGLPVGTVNVYLFTQPEPVLVDTGVKSEESKVALQAALSNYGLGVDDLAKIVITHPHIDHFGLAGWLAEYSHAQFLIFEPGLPWLLDFTAVWQRRFDYYAHDLFPRLGLPHEIGDPIIDYYLSIKNAHDPLPPERATAFQNGDCLAMGGANWRVVYTPGHTYTQTCFYQPDTRQFLAADMLLARAPTPIADPPPSGKTERVPSLPQFISSLEIVEELDIHQVYPGHGDPFTGHKDLIQRQRKRIHRRKLEALGLIQAGHHTVAPLLMKLYAHYPPRYRFAGLWMLLGYLDLLKAEGRVIETEVDGVWRYAAAGG
ncbi:MAG TPA: MBL fold metallo-hydrolase [Chloroflexi bacterium]|nr:MBL fold metallo-hydrolase [Chloroflexota bacterium]